MLICRSKISPFNPFLGPICGVFRPLILSYAHSMRACVSSSSSSTPRSRQIPASRCGRYPIAGLRVGRDRRARRLRIIRLSPLFRTVDRGYSNLFPSSGRHAECAPVCFASGLVVALLLGTSFPPQLRTFSARLRLSIVNPHISIPSKPCFTSRAIFITRDY